MDNVIAALRTIFASGIFKIFNLFNQIQFTPVIYEEINMSILMFYIIIRTKILNKLIMMKTMNLIKVSIKVSVKGNPDLLAQNCLQVSQ